MLFQRGDISSILQSRNWYSTPANGRPNGPVLGQPRATPWGLIAHNPLFQPQRGGPIGHRQRF